MNALKSNKAELLSWAVIITGALLRLRQYFLNRSFWADEASLAFNLVTRNYAQLTQPLDYQQGAPIGFLFVEKTALLLFGNHEYSLRLFPLISGILAIYLLYRIVREHFGASGLFAVAALAIGWDMAYYSSELKQYSSDAAIALLLIYLALRLLDDEMPRARNYITLGAVGFLVIWVSHPSSFALAGVGITLLILKLMRKNHAPFAWILALGFIWLASFSVEYIVSLQNLAADEYLQEYWGKAFAPMPPWSNWRWFYETYISLMGVSLSTEQISTWLALALGIIGSASLFIRKGNLAAILALTTIAALGASALQKYPLKSRFMLFLVPIFLLVITEGIRRVYETLAKKNRAAALVLSTLPALWLLYFPLTVTSSEIRLTRPDVGMRPVVAYIAQNKKADERIYVYHSADPSFTYYALMFGIDAKSPGVMMGKSIMSKKRALKSFLEDVDALEGSGKVWFVFTDIVDCGGCEGNMQTYYIGELNQRGRMLEQINVTGANGYLYDMTP